MKIYNCPICDRPFVSQQRLAGHLIECEKAAQEKLDKEWKGDQQKRL